MNPRERLIDRFIRYVQIGSSANPDSSRYPSSDGQRILGNLLVQELRDMGLREVEQDIHGLVWATVPGNIPSAPVVLLNAHLDTSPEAPGENVSPQVIRKYSGGDVPLLNGDTITVQSTPELSNLVGQDLIVTDGTTLLGGDDKAGVAAIMEIAQRSLENPSIRRGNLRILFTCDEEIGLGTKYFDLAKCGACVGYTLDGGGSGNLDVETFSADMATIRFIGTNTHPSVGKGKMRNAIKAASYFVSQLPQGSMSPETTSEREGFLHPFRLEGAVGQSTLQILLRDFETRNLSYQAQLLDQLREKTAAVFPGVDIEITIAQQYRNMGDTLRAFPLAVDLAERAYRDLQMPCKRDIIRGGTDGALMTALGLPTPNLSVGQFNIHSTREFVSVDCMEDAISHMIHLLSLWSEQRRES
jgi:tripeptide aminopeptidase